MGFETAGFLTCLTSALDTREEDLLAGAVLTMLNSSGPFTTLLVLAGVVFLTSALLGAVLFTTFLGVGSFLGVSF